jgi:hypothetical protein
LKANKLFNSLDVFQAGEVEETLNL